MEKKFKLKENLEKMKKRSFKIDIIIIDTSLKICVLLQKS